MSLPYGNQAELTRYFSGKKPGDQVTINELMGRLGIGKNQARDVISYLRDTGILERRSDGIYLTSRNLDGNYRQATDSVQGHVEGSIPQTHAVAHIPANTSSPAYPFASRTDVLTPEVAYKLFDPNDHIFRGVVVDEAESRIDPVTDKYVRRSAGVRVLTSDGSRFGIVSSPQKRYTGSEYGYDDYYVYRPRRSRRGQKVSIIGSQMKNGGHVLVRHAGEFVGKSGRATWLFEPLFQIREDDYATLNGERIATRIDGDRILYLPIVEPGKVRSGVLNGVGYIDEENDFTPVYVDGAGDKVWLILPEVNARKVTKQDDSLYGNGFSHAFYIGELPTSPDAKTTRELAKVDSAIGYAELQLRMLDLNQAVNGHPEGNPALQTAYKIALGLFKTAREAGRTPEVAERRDRIKGLLSKAAAIETLRKKEIEMISGFYQEGSEEYRKFMDEWPEMLESYLDTLEARGAFRSWRVDENASARREKKRSEILHHVPVDDMLVTGLFNRDVINGLTYDEFREYLGAVNKAFGIASDAVDSSHNWLGDFSIGAVLRTAQGVIDERLPDIMEEGFRGIDVEAEWKRIAESLKGRNYDLRIGTDPSKVDISMRLMRPYLEWAKEIIQ